MKRLYIILFAILIGTCTFAQLSTNEKPLCIDMREHNKSLPAVKMPELDVQQIVKEDEADEANGVPPRFGYPHEVNYNLNNSGVWKELPNGDKIWQLRIICPDALSINILYDKFWIPEGGKLFIYSTDGKHSIGAFTSKNNKGDNINVRGFATGLVFGDDIIIEYFQPNDVTPNAIISIKSVIHGYKYIRLNNRGIGDSGDCEVNVNCTEGSDWKQEKNAVALIVMGGTRLCTGSLINTTNLSQEPFLLTADHCVSAMYKDSEMDNVLDEFTFYWNFESPGCNTISLPSYATTIGGTLLANCDYSDFALIKLEEDPQNTTSQPLFYSGWDKSGVAGNAGVCIHHPRGDIKKISMVQGTPFSARYLNTQQITNASHWCVYWNPSMNGWGVTEPGSSGSALFNSNRKIIGQLHGGYSSCADYYEPDWYGKFSDSWVGYNTTNIHRRLNCWLDSLGVNCNTMDGLVVVRTAITLTANEILNNNISINNGGTLTIQNNAVMGNNNKLMIKSGGRLVVNGVTFSNVSLTLEAGAYLEITNGGILEFVNNFIVPLGATIKVIDGKILPI